MWMTGAVAPLATSKSGTVYVNDVVTILRSHCSCKLFADDLKLHSVTHFCEDDAVIIQNSLENYHWSSEWQVTIWHRKCSIMSMGRSVSTDCDCFIIGSELYRL
jgi:hypothetical protein